MTIDYLNLIVSSTIQAAVGFGIWFALQRAVEHRDRKIEQIERDMSDMRDNKIAHLEKRLNGKEFRRVELCEQVHRDLSKRLDDGSDEFGEHSDDITYLKTMMARVEENQKIVMKSMSLKWSEKPS